MEVTVSKINKSEVSEEDSWWFSIYDELWVVETSSHPRNKFGSLEDALEDIINSMTNINLAVNYRG